MENKKPEVWLRGPLANISGLLQPVAHALMQAGEEVNELMIDFPEASLWEKPAGVASVGFHLQHLSGVLDRLFTYAKNKQLNAQQLDSLSIEGKPFDHISGGQLVQLFNIQVDTALQDLSSFSEQALLETRGVGRAKIPSTALGLLVHSAEHTMRHVGQLLVTIQVIKASL